MQTSLLNKRPAAVREFESAGEKRDLAAILVNRPESAAKRSTSATRCQKGRNVRQLWQTARRKK